MRFLLAPEGPATWIGAVAGVLSLLFGSGVLVALWRKRRRPVSVDPDEGPSNKTVQHASLWGDCSLALATGTVHDEPLLGDVTYHGFRPNLYNEGPILVAREHGALVAIGPDDLLPFGNVKVPENNQQHAPVREGHCYWVRSGMALYKLRCEKLRLTVNPPRHRGGEPVPQMEADVEWVAWRTGTISRS